MTVRYDNESRVAPSDAPGPERRVNTLGPRVPASPAQVLALQRSFGNAAVTRALAATGVTSGARIQRSILDTIGDALDARPDEDRLDALEDLEAFRQRTFTPLVRFKPSSGSGMFDARLDPRAGILHVTLKVAYAFVDGDPARVTPGFRPDEFTWSADDQTAWKARYLSAVATAWSSEDTQLFISSTKPFWDELSIETRVIVVEDDKHPHYRLTIAKYPPDSRQLPVSVCAPGNHHDAAHNCVPNADVHDETATADLTSNDLRLEATLDSANEPIKIPFAVGSSALTEGAPALTRVIAQLGGDHSAHVTLIGRASTKHKAGRSLAEGVIDNMDLARARSATVHTALTTAGVPAERILVRNAGETRAAADDSWCRVDARVGNQQPQVAALHETGHMLGNRDEYHEAGTKPGEPLDPDYNAMIQSATGDVVTRHDSEDIMANGSTVQRWNYAAFLEALKNITSETEWTL